VVVLHDGEMALREANATRYNFIVLDVMLPSIDGFEVLRRLAQGAHRQPRLDSDGAR
jgi:DNA-binding response OmpR family regulator